MDQVKNEYEQERLRIIIFETRLLCYSHKGELARSTWYRMLISPVYAETFEYPIGGGNWYKGSYKPLITKDVFEQVHKQLIVPKKSKWGGKTFTFKELFKCASRMSLVIGDDRCRKRKYSEPRYHIYYHCTRQKKYGCPEPYITEEKLIIQILRYINFMHIAHPQLFDPNNFLKYSMGEYKKMRDKILCAQDINPDKKSINLMDYANYAIRNGTFQEKREITNVLNRQLYIHNETVTSLPLI